MLKLVNINKTYFSKKGADCSALKDVSLTLPRSGLVFILGKSGSGKSTLLNIIGGLDKATSGNISYDGTSFESFTDRDYDSYRNTTIGFIFQEYNLIDKFNVFQNIDIATKMQGESHSDAQIADVLKTVGLENYEKRQISELSGGQKQRIAIARALVKNSKIILADEPTGNLDSETSVEIFNLLQEISKDKLVIVVSHDRENAEKYADRIIELKDGKIIYDESVSTRALPVGLEESFKAVNNNKSAKPKLSFGYAFKMAMHNLLYKKVRSVLTIVIAALAILLLCFSQVVYSFDAEKAIVQSAINMDKEYLSLQKLIGKGDDGKRFYDKSISQGACREISNTANARYIKRYLGSQYVIEKAQDIGGLGYEMYDGYLQLDNDGRYYTDYAIQKLLKRGTVDYDGEFAYQKIVGKQIKEAITDFSGTHYKYYDKILGIIKTEYAGFVDEKLEIIKEIPSQNKGDEEYSRAYNNFIESKDTSFISYDKLIYGVNTYELTNGYDRNILESYQQPVSDYFFSFSSGDKTVEFVDNNPIEVKEYGSVLALTKNGYQHFDNQGNTLGAGEIIISLDIYNSLFNNEIVPLTEKTQSPNFNPGDFSTYYLADYAPKHLGEKLDFSLIQNSIGTSYLDLKDKMIVGVEIVRTDVAEIERGRRNYAAYVGTNEISDHVLIDYYTDSINDGILLKLTDFKSSVNLLKVLRNKYSMYVNGGNSFGEIFYNQEDSNAMAGAIFIAIAIISLIITVLLVVSLLSLSITARKKEIGILRALGASSKDVTMIFILESLFIGLIVFAISLALVAISISAINKSFSITTMLLGAVFFMTNVLTYLIIVGISFGLILLVSYLPLTQFNKMKPIDSIKS